MSTKSKANTALCLLNDVQLKQPQAIRREVQKCLKNYRHSHKGHSKEKVQILRLLHFR